MDNWIKTCGTILDCTRLNSISEGKFGFGLGNYLFFTFVDKFV